MAETFLSVGLDKLWDLLVRESDRFKGVDEQFTLLKSELETLRGFLKDADAKKHKSEMVRNNVKEIKEIVCDAEDIIETFVLTEQLGKTSGFKKRIRQLACIISDRREIAIDMEALSTRIKKVNRDMQNLGVQNFIVNERHMESLQRLQMELLQTFSSDNEDHPVGLEKNVEKLVGHLMEEDSSQVVSITGMGGLGKTTLARQVFNHETIKNHFAGLAWVCVSQQFRRGHVWQTILRKLAPEYVKPKMADEELQEKLFQVLGTQKALIVLDDIWREEDWQRIKPMFPPKKGWKVLFTSRIEGISLQAYPTCYTLKPDYLTPEESWTLFRRIAFPSENTTEYKVDEEMEEMGKQMIKHCGGLPLAVKVLGGLLAAQYTLREWKRINENIRSHIVGGTSFNERSISSVYHVLHMSYEELPIYLKHCFIYLAHFPEDTAINVGDLSYYWEAEEIPRPRHYDGATIGEVADGYIEELVRRNMVISKKGNSTSRFEVCRLHDMMREVCLHEAEEENFVQIVDTSTFTSPAISQSHCKSHRLCLHSSDDTIHMEGYIKNPKLRSLLIVKKPYRGSKWMASGLCFTRLQLMRVLDLSGAEFHGGKLPSNIGKLVHLRYLSLYMTNLSQLPDSMQNLKLLLYLNLNVKAGPPLDVPNILKEMQGLRYLWLPRQIHDKANLELGNLTSLETLENFSTKHSSVSDLHHMKRLGTLSILFNGECTMESLSLFLGKMRHLENLTISNQKAGIKDLFSDFIRCLEEAPLPIQETVPQLKENGLLGERSCSRTKIVCPRGGFPQLQNLVLENLDQLEEWIVEEGSMPFLHNLSITHCNNLKELPDGMRFITSLKELSIVTTEKKFKEKLYRGGEDHYKVQHIPLIKIPVASMTYTPEERYGVVVRIDNQVNMS